MSAVYRIYAITCIETNEKYFGVTKSTWAKYDPISILYKQHKKYENSYVKLAKSIELHGAKKHMFKFGNMKFDNEYDAAVIAYNNNLKNKDNCLVDKLVKPEMDTCAYCNKEFYSIRKYEHDESCEELGKYIDSQFDEDF